MEKQQSNTSKVMKGMSSQTVVTIAVGVLEIVSFSIMSRLLSQDDFGYYAAITAITNIFSTFSETGIGAAIIQQKELSKRFVNNAFTINLLFGSFISLLLLALAGPLSNAVADASMRVPLMLMSVTLLLNCLTSVNRSIMHRRLQFLRMGSINLISLIITTCVAVILAYNGYGYYAIITKAVLGSIITYFVSLYLCKTRFSLALDKGTFKQIFSFSGWLMASSLFRNLAHQIDKLLMPRLLSVNALGSYNRPKEFVENGSSMLNGIFDTALFPVLSGIQDDQQRLKSAFKRSMYFMNIAALLLTLGCAFNSGLIIRIFFGEKWMYLETVTIIISFSFRFNIDGRVAVCYLRSMALTKQQFYFRIFETVLKTAGVLIGYRWDIIGVALSVVLTNFIAKIVKIIYIGKKVDVTPRQTIGIIVFSWRYALLLLPVSVVAFLLLPNTWGGDLAMAVIFVLLMIVIFLFMPKFVGMQYYNDAYKSIMSVIKRKLHIK